MKKKYDNIISVIGTTQKFGLEFKNQVSIVFVDGGHDYYNTYTDAVIWTKHIAHGGYMLFHDSSGLTFNGVEKVIKQYVFKCGLFKLCGIVGSIFIAQRKDLNFFDKINNILIYFYWTMFRCGVKINNTFWKGLN